MRSTFFLLLALKTRRIRVLIPDRSPSTTPLVTLWLIDTCLNEDIVHTLRSVSNAVLVAVPLQVSSAKANIDVALAKLPTDEMLSKDPQMLQNIRKATYPILTQLRPVPIPTAAAAAAEAASRDDDITPDDV